MNTINIHKINKYRNGENLIDWDNQQERLERYPEITENLKWFLAGFADGESSFCLNLKNRPNSKFGYSIDPAFYVYQHSKNRYILETFKYMFNCGSIHLKTSPNSVLTYQIAGIKNNLSKVIPFFDQYSLITKKETFKYFKEGVYRLKNKEHFSESGYIEIIEIAYKMNQLGKGRKWQKEFVLSRILRD